MGLATVETLHRGYVLEPGFLTKGITQAVSVALLFPKWFKRAVAWRKGKNLKVMLWMAETYKKAVDAANFLMMAFGKKQGIVFMEWNEWINEWGGYDDEGPHLGTQWSLGHCVETKLKMGRRETVGQVLGCKFV